MPFRDPVQFLILPPGATVPPYLNTLVTDAFNRNVSNGWGFADTGQLWTNIGGAASDYSVSSFDTAGHHSNTSVNVSRNTILASPTVTDFDMYGSVTTPVVPTGGSHFAYLIGRWTDTNNHYAARVEFDTASAIKLTIRIRNAGVDSILSGTFTLGLLLNPGTPYHVRFQISNSSLGSQLRAKIWSGLNEPLTWGCFATDSTFASGLCGFRSVLSAACTNVLPVSIAFGFPGLTLTALATSSAVLFAGADITPLISGFPGPSPTPGLVMFTGADSEINPAALIAFAQNSGNSLRVQLYAPNGEDNVSAYGDALILEGHHSVLDHSTWTGLGPGAAAFFTQNADNVSISPSGMAFISAAEILLNSANISLDTNDGNGPLNIAGAWTAYTPTWIGSTTNPTNVTQVGRYIRIGKLVIGAFQLTAAGGFINGSGFYSVALPFAGVATIRQEPGTARLSLGGTEFHAGCSMDAGDNKLTRIRISESSAAYAQGSTPWTATVPVVPVAGDVISGQFIYEMA